MTRNCSAVVLSSAPVACSRRNNSPAELVSNPWNRAAAELKARFKISLADAFAAALAKEKKAELVTGDPEFKALEEEIKVIWIS